MPDLGFPTRRARDPRVYNPDLRKLRELEGSIHGLRSEFQAQIYTRSRSERSRRCRVGWRSRSCVNRNRGRQPRSGRRGGYTPDPPDPPDPPRSGEFDPSAESSVRRGQSYRSGSEVRKIKMPTCDGENLLVWLNQAEHYFALHEMSELSKLRAARICLIGPAQIWLQNEESETPFNRWTELRAQLCRRFTETNPLYLRRPFFAIKQDPTVAEHRKRVRVSERTIVSDEAKSMAQESVAVAGVRNGEAEHGGVANALGSRLEASVVVEASKGSDLCAVLQGGVRSEELKREMHTKKKAEQSSLSS
ncbi:hypothetical protein Scep_014619 [Stephania cephalantha]|uniref:Retrotransposon gag domain-containing protein n=1 Tax=Stephania cephalantha TaxID=152367 RepID=A0AAP0J1N4_9MAGN